ncbi:helix-turn-helix transcriptional regulator [Pelagibius sp. Alg239-R121]|uniref:ArsR/SmtB family transcription factor n=1 Tax=Pelagibius sp. Alg239-R121 TaxID=2993448 RepID=UPI0024A743D1|nr:metalloregulator ArsR/SmtB family transcription factor [Pelagibius sp. Alg239-R121]
MPAIDPLSQTFAALADPTRRAILERLTKGAAPVGELAAPFDISAPAISRHLKVLEKAGLVRRQTDAQWRRCSLQPEPLMAVDKWIGQHRKFWERQFDQLARYLDRAREIQLRAEKASLDPTAMERGNGKPRK